MSEKKAGKSTKSARKAKGAAKRSSRGGVAAVATDSEKAVAKRVAALTEAPLAVCDSDENLQAALKVLRDQSEPPEVRHAALQALQAASFSVLTFESCRGDYIAALREVVDDPDPELRQRVLGILSRENDGFAQKKLLDGLRNPEKALVPPEKALQLLSYDVHAEAYPLAREIVKNPPNTAAKREALRMLAADATAAPIFEKVLRDKTEDPEIRQISAAALHSLKPEKMQEHAREIVLDTSEQPDLQAASLTALTQFGDAEAVAKDEKLLKRVDRLKGEGSTKVKQTARRFLDKYGR
jgi:uncharacterized protein (UPF0147 family)